MRSHVSIYPEEGGGFLSEVKHGRKWLHQMPAELLSPMVRVDNKDFYIFEPCMLRSGVVVMPTRWFTKRSDPGVVWGRGWTMSLVSNQNDGAQGWRVDCHSELFFRQDELSWDYPTFLELHGSIDVPSPAEIWG